MSTIALTDIETAIREKLIKAASEGKKIYYSDLIDGDASLVYREQTVYPSIYHCPLRDRSTRRGLL